LGYFRARPKHFSVGHAAAQREHASQPFLHALSIPPAISEHQKSIRLF
jgi:hypothetical protein